jgi:16S rRNA (cytosine967-C5)-methyltransferase
MPSRQPDHVTARQAAIIPELLAHVAREVEQGRPADATLASYFRAHREFGARDRRLFSQVVFSYYRWLGWLRDVEPARAAALAWLRDTGETHPVIERLLGDGPREIPEQSTDLLVPPWLREELAGDFERFVQSIQARPPTWLRMRKGHEDEIYAQVGRGGPPRRGGVGHAALPIQPMDLAALRKKLGPVFEVQDLASQCVGSVAEPEAGETWWDVCAGAGGKSLHLADLMEGRKGHKGPKGKIVATDIRAGALRELERRARDAAIEIIRTNIEHPASSIRFDGVLIDAPCSGIGTWSRNPDMRWRTPRAAVHEKAALQARLLAEHAEAVKPGGKLVYAVCTVTRSETIGIVSEFLSTRSDFKLEPVPHPLSGVTTDGQVWIWPWDGPCDGMFIARLRRVA